MAVVAATVKLFPPESLTTTLITEPFFTVTAGWTTVFSEAVINVLEADITLVLTGPDTFSAIAKESVFVVSPFAFFSTTELEEEDADGLGDGGIDGDDDGVGFGCDVAAGVGEGVGVGDALTEGEGDGVNEATGEGAINPPPPPPPPKPPPPPPPPPEFALGVGEALAEAVGVGATVATGAAVTLRLPDSSEYGLIPTPFVEAIFVVYEPVAKDVKTSKV